MTIFLDCFNRRYRLHHCLGIPQSPANRQSNFRVWVLPGCLKGQSSLSVHYMHIYWRPRNIKITCSGLKSSKTSLSCALAHWLLKISHSFFKVSYLYIAAKVNLFPYLFLFCSSLIGSRLRPVSPSVMNLSSVGDYGFSTWQSSLTSQLQLGV